MVLTQRLTKLLKEHALGPYGVMIAATMVANVINYFYIIAMGRILGPSTFSALASLVAISIILVVAFGTVSTITTRYVSADIARGCEENAKYITWRALGVLSSIGCIVFLVVFASSWQLSTWLKIGTVFPCILLAIRIGLGFISPVPMGALQGLERFDMFALATLGWATTRFVVGVSLVALGFDLNGAMIGEVAGILAMVVIPLLALRTWLLGRPSTGSIDIKHLMRFIPAVLVGTSCTAAFLAIDVILVRAWIGGDPAGYYAGAQKMSTIVYFLPAAVAVVMFPRVSAESALEKTSWQILLQSLAIVAVLCGLTCGLFALFPSQLLQLMFGSSYLPGAHLVPVFSLAMFSFSLVSIMTYFLLGTDRFNAVYILAIGLGLECVAISLFHASIDQVAWIVTGVGVLLALSMGSYLFLDWRIHVRDTAKDLL